MYTNQTEFHWDTWFDTAQNMMHHKFSERLTVMTNLVTGQIKVIKDGNVVSTIEGEDMSVTEYENILVRTQQEAMTLTIINQ